MIIKIEIYDETGKLGEDALDLSTKFSDRRITKISPATAYVADNSNDFLNDPNQGVNNQFNVVSGGQILPHQPTSKIYSQSVQNFNAKVSVNIKVRYDKNEPLTSRWNIDVYVDVDDDNLNWNEKRLIEKHPKKQVHKVRDCDWIRVDYWIDGVKQPSIKSIKPN